MLAEDDLRKPLTTDSDDEYEVDYREKDDGFCFDHCVKTKVCGGRLTCCSFRSRFHGVVCTSMFFIVMALLFAVIVPPIFDFLEELGIADEVVIDSIDAKNYDIWQSNYFGKGDKNDIGYDVYIFHVSNPEASLKGEKPKLVQMGPYAFKNYFNKFDIRFRNGGDEVQYRLQTFYIPYAEGTGPGLSFDDELVIPYVSALGFEYLLKEIPVETEQLLDAALTTLVDTTLEKVEGVIETREQAVIDNPFMSDEQKNQTLLQLQHLYSLVEIIRVDMDNYIEEASAGSSLLKLILCQSFPDQPGASLYWKTDPISAYFGWLNDPLKVQVQLLLDSLNLTDVPWDTSNPGATTNYTSEADATRRRDINVQKTGQKNMKEIGQYVLANNQTTQYVCVDPMASQDPTAYVEGEEYPWCEPFQLEWDKETAYAKGYVLVFNSDYANRIAGTDANLFGAPVDSEKMLVYVNDIYRTSFLIYEKDTTDWHGVTLRRYGIQNKDFWNETLNPEEAWQYYNFGPSGMQNLTQVATLPLFLSKPHFLDGDSSLLAGVKGLNPVRSIHDTYLDIEPNTGALCRVHNRAQVSYQMNSMNLPEVSITTAVAAEELCASLSTQNSTCDNLDTLMTCLASPSNWKMYNDRVYVPYAWIDQYTVGSPDDARAIKEGLYSLDNFANEIQFWCYVSAGLLAFSIAGMYCAKYILNIEGAENRHEYMSPSVALD